MFYGTPSLQCTLLPKRRKGKKASTRERPKFAQGWVLWRSHEMWRWLWVTVWSTLKPRAEGRLGADGTGTEPVAVLWNELIMPHLGSLVEGLD